MRPLPGADTIRNIMTPRIFRFAATVVAGLILVSVPGEAGRAQDTARLDDTARLLAGMPGRTGSAFKDLETREVWRQYAAEMGKIIQANPRLLADLLADKDLSPEVRLRLGQVQPLRRPHAGLFRRMHPLLAPATQPEK